LYQATDNFLSQNGGLMKLTVAGARIAIVGFSLGITGVLLTFLILAPALGMPFNPGRNENVRLIEIIVPVFFGYLGSAAHFIFRSRRGAEISVNDETLLALLIYGPFLIFITINIALFAAFYLYNRPDGPGMDVEELSKWFSFGLGILTCTVSVISSYIFGSTGRHRSVKAGA
jgi:hypothetical protein